MNIDKDQIIEWTKEYFGEILAGLCILIIVFMIIIFKKQFVVSILATLTMLAIGVERRARVFDKTVAILVIFSLAFGFMLFD